MSELVRMRWMWGLALVGVVALGAGRLTAEEVAETKEAAEEEGWISLFNGKDLTGWEANENPETFKVVDGELIVNGDRAHLFYTGDVCDHDFTNFEWKCEIMTKPKSNSGMYFHTKFQESGWPEKGYEVQVNCSHGDNKKSGGLYAVEDVLDKAPHKDNEWFTQHVIVKGNHVVIKVNGEVTCDYTEPEDVERPNGFKGRVLSSGTFAIQGHDPGSEVHFRKILVKPLDE
ncbi:3-keto-disaccharide hydrolase [Aeoliella mucimassa]|uniref:3-keto-alpha-glucoside-1,2-lyase/3-keto-2-hydroxy-glucal hydratase domain-containing protein n=1 Tax=Aeoliella mucimassa TaxID=2527972 RepID=A0A518ASQ8_9BACT|nr:DUF1080 domain-containing protein [Aeoliella mucimassa]QDU57755.1 hypothetical protein Pan181_39770 [Aeoliella mucimassa]